MKRIHEFHVWVEEQEGEESLDLRDIHVLEAAFRKAPNDHYRVYGTICKHWGLTEQPIGEW